MDCYYNQQECAHFIGPSLKGRQSQVKYKRGKPAAARRLGKQLASIVALTRITALLVENSQAYSNHKRIKFDTDLFLLTWDIGTSCCMSNNRSQFVDMRMAHDAPVKGIGEGLIAEGQGMVLWHIHDDEGIVHAFEIRNCLYVPQLPCCLVYPQQIVKQARDKYPRCNGTKGEVLEEEIVLH